MSESSPHISLTRRANVVTLVVGAGTVPGFVDRVGVLSEGVVLFSRVLDPPFDAGTDRLEVDLLDDGAVFVDPVVEVHYRRPQPEGEVQAPPTRVSFRLTPGTEPHTWGIAPDVATRTAASRRNLVDRYWATLDFGTSRAVAAIQTKRRIHNTAGILPASARERVTAASGISFSPKRDAGLTIDFETDGEPEQCAALWRTVLNTPPLDHQHLESTQVFSSDIVVDGGRVELDPDGAAGGKRIRGVKRRLLDLDEEIPGTGLSGIDVYRQIYERFVELVESTKLAGESLTRIFVTYPTRLPPDIRARLKAALQEVVDLVELEVDEAVAAAGFFLMRRFGADPALGAEAFKLTARGPSGRSVWDDYDRWKATDRWHENLLVVDVGGGTTDCALVKMLLVDQTPGDIRPGGGRFYRLQPEVRSSGGRMHLGGDLFTIEIFRRLKLAYEIHDESTRFRGAGSETDTRRATFEALWEIAELVKVAGLGGEEPVDVVVGPGAGEKAGDDDESIAYVAVDNAEPHVQRQITVRADDLVAWVAAPLKRIGALAAGIASGGLTADPDDGFRESVDHVLFSGGSLQSGYLRARIEAELRSQFAAEGMAATFAVAAFDDAYCKTGTALGGMYLNAIADEQFHPEQVAVREDLNDGIPHFRVDTSHLRVNLAANFHVAMEHEQVHPRPTFRCGRPLHQDGGGRCFAEAGPYGLGTKFHVHRFDIPREQVREQAGEDTLWATANILVRRQAEELSRHGAQVYYEIDEREQVTLLLRTGDPGWLLDGDVESLPKDVPALVRTDEDRRPVLAVGLYRDVFLPAAGTVERDALVEAGAPLAPWGLLIPVDGRKLYYRDPEKSEHVLLANLSDRTRWISIDPAGDLRLHDRRPQRDTVASPMDLIGAEPGRSYAVAMVSSAEYDVKKDPFGGTH